MRTYNRIKGFQVLLFFMGILFATSLLCGCSKSGSGKKNPSGQLDYETDETGLAKTLGVPRTYSATIPTNSSGLDSITIKAEDIVLPDRERMSISHYHKIERDAEYKKNIAEAVFDDNSEIYIYDYNPSKEDISLMIQYYKTCLQVAYDHGDEMGIDSYQIFLEDQERMYEDAPDTRTVAVDYSADAYIGQIGDQWYMLSFGDMEEEGKAGFELSIYPWELLINYRPYEDMCYLHIGNEMGDLIDQEVEGVENKCNLTEEEAVSKAEEFLFRCGITNISAFETGNLEWHYMQLLWGESGATVDEYDGYYVTFGRSIDGDFPYFVYYSWLDNIDLNEYWEEQAGETFTIFVDDNGIVGAECNQMFEATGESSEDAVLLSWEQVIEALETAIPEYYEKYPTAYGSINFNYIRLTYFMIPDGNGEYICTPVWVFEEVEDIMKEYDYYYLPTQLFILNAITGEYVDLEEVLK